MPDANSHDNIEEILGRARMAERQSGSPAKMPLTDGPACIPIVMSAQKKALINVVTFEDSDIEIDRGTIEIPREIFDVIRSEGTCSLDWSDGALTINLGLYHQSLSIHICPKGD